MLGELILFLGIFGFRDRITQDMWVLDVVIFYGHHTKVPKSNNIYKLPKYNCSMSIVMSVGVELQKN